MPWAEGDKRRYQKMLNIQQLFDSSQKLKKMGVIEDGRQLEIYARWGEIVGAGVARNSRPLKLRNRVLTVAVANPTWMQQLTMLKPTLIQALEREIGPGIIQDIRLTTRDWDTGPAPRA